MIKSARFSFKVIGITLALLSANPLPGHSFLMVFYPRTGTPGSDFLYDMGPLGGLAGVLCLLTLPVCILNEPGKNNPLMVNDSELRESGYSENEIAIIQTDQNQLGARLRGSNQMIMPSPNVAANSLSGFERVVREIYPQVSNLYLRVLAERAGIR